MSLAGYLPNSTDKFFGLLRRLSRQIVKRQRPLKKSGHVCLIRFFPCLMVYYHLSDALMRMDGYTTTLIPLMSLLLETPLLHQPSKQTTDQKRKECALLLLSIVCCFRHKKKLTDHTTIKARQQWCKTKTLPVAY